MSLFDKLGGVVGQMAATAAPGLITAALAKTNLGDLQGLVNKLRQGGLEAQVKSWLGSGANLPISPDQIQTALGNEQLKQLAEYFGIPVNAAAKFFAEHLPATIDQASPNGKLN